MCDLGQVPSTHDSLPSSTQQGLGVGQVASVHGGRWRLSPGLCRCSQLWAASLSRAVCLGWFTAFSEALSAAYWPFGVPCFLFGIGFRGYRFPWWLRQ